MLCISCYFIVRWVHTLYSSAIVHVYVGLQRLVFASLCAYVVNFVSWRLRESGSVLLLCEYEFVRTMVELLKTKARSLRRTRKNLATNLAVRCSSSTRHRMTGPTLILELISDVM